jgi:uncharacterized membrane protein YciS (DUF1049 family)
MMIYYSLVANLLILAMLVYMLVIGICDLKQMRIHLKEMEERTKRYEETARQMEIARRKKSIP